MRHAAPRLIRLKNFTENEIKPYIISKNKNKMLKKSKKMAKLAKEYRKFPYQCYKSALYERAFDGDVQAHMPPSMIYEYLSRVNTAEGVSYTGDKQKFRRTLEAAGLPVVRELFRIDRDGVILDPDDRPLAAPEARNTLADHGAEIFIKPIDGIQGQGAHVRAVDDSDAIFALRNVLVQPRLRQHPALARLYPQAVNTVRIDTLATDVGCISNAAVLRIGSGGAVVDNGSAGGLLAGIDLGTGRVRPQARRRARFGAGWYDRHPDTGVAFGDLAIPRWELLRATVARAGEVLLSHGLVSVGWDVAVLPEGFSLIEGNHIWDVNVMGGLGETEVGRRALNHAGLVAGAPQLSRL